MSQPFTAQQFIADSALTRENNQAAGKTWVWTYDDAGNIVNESQYVYTTGTLGTATVSRDFTYGDGAWGDLLTNWHGYDITYDAIGNVLSDRDSVFTWEHGRELTSMTAVGFLWQFTYDQNGMRTSRTNGTRVYNYVYNGGSLSQMTVGDNTLYFTYDASGTPLAVTYNGTNYYYATNLQGDVVAILDGSGTAVVNYTYDAWGSCFTTTGSMASNIGAHNPLRYRGYVYDEEYALYYLQSRYYDPLLGRFLNADALVSTGQGLLGNNMFAYCNNNPVNYIDSLGLSPMYPWEDIPGYLGRLIGEWISEVIKTDEEETDEEGNTTLNAKVKKTAKSVGRNVEFSAGFGQGYYAEVDIMEVGASLGMYGNYGTINYKDGNWYTGQEVNIGLSLSATQWLEVGFGDYTFLQSGKVIESSTWTGLNNTKESWTIFSFSGYFIAGGSIYVGFDLNTFLTDFESIWMGG